MSEQSVATEQQENDVSEMQYEWRCMDCKEKAPPDAANYTNIIKHQKGHHIRLVEITSGKVLASNIQDARNKGFDIPGKTVAPSEATGGKVLVADKGMVKHSVVLPLDVWTMYSIAGDQDKRPPDQTFDEWLADCVQIAFNVGYNLQIALVPYQTTEESPDGAKS